MMKNLRSLACLGVVAGALSSGAHAAPTTLNFESLDLPNGTLLTTEYSAAGVVFSGNAQFFNDTAVLPPAPGSKFLLSVGGFRLDVDAAATTFDIFTVTYLNSVTFNIVDVQGRVKQVPITVQNGTQVWATENVVLDRTTFGEIDFIDFAVDSGARVAVDNIVLDVQAVTPPPPNPTPEPAGLGLAALALAGVALARRRR